MNSAVLGAICWLQDLHVRTKTQQKKTVKDAAVARVPVQHRTGCKQLTPAGGKAFSKGFICEGVFNRSTPQRTVGVLPTSQIYTIYERFLVGRRISARHRARTSARTFALARRVAGPHTSPFSTGVRVRLTTTMSGPTTTKTPIFAFRWAASSTRRHASCCWLTRWVGCTPAHGGGSS